MMAKFWALHDSLMRALQLGINCIEFELNAKAVDIVKSNIMLRVLASGVPNAKYLAFGIPN